MSSTTATEIQDRLQQNIEAVTQDPSTTLDTRTFEEAELILPKVLEEEQRLALIQTLAALLPTLEQDPAPAINLLLRFLDDLSYADLLNFGSLQYIEGLAVGDHMVSFNKLIMTLLEKATAKPADAAHVASMLDTMLALVRLWLCTTDTGIASQASKLLLDLLRIDQEVLTDPDDRVPHGGQGLVWKRLFNDRNVYSTIFEACSLSGPSSLKLSKSQRTLAQARLMEWLPAVGALDWNVISRSHHAEVEEAYGVKEGLLEFAALGMVDYKDDVLMHRCLIDFYSDLLHAVKPSASELSIVQDSPALLYLISQGLHVRTAMIYLQPPGAQPDPVESMFLYGPAANYIATYASSYPDHFLASQMPKQVNDHLTGAFDLSPAKWAHAESPKHDLHLAASLPRSALLPRGDGGGPWNLSPISLLPSRSTNPDVLNTLATIFHGPDREILTFPSSSPVASMGGTNPPGGSAARALYFHYLANNPQLWRDIAVHADTVALKDLALAAIHCLTAVITANWANEPALMLPSTIATPECGSVAILSPPSLEYSLPYLLKPPQTFANLVGGRGDAESAAYQIASAKFDALRAMHSRVTILVDQQPGAGYEEILATIGKRLAEGPLSREGEVGGRISTMEL